ncbi:hypothetical protein [Streptomyces sp. SID3343]|uniref:hypothetical protein n=1 Tax=Streptomyces sp. SID3343 TaxID=2690260 RepID=UPI00136C85E9|nr:hypothetical protein [Streptomyces sp. SID3343]MYW06208.1 hypothetical protein [Streptomyces sp. SID3343]
MYATTRFHTDAQDAVDHLYGPAFRPLSPRPTLVHANTGRPRTDTDDPLTFAKDLDVQLSARSSLIGARVDAPVWHCVLEQNPGSRRLADAEWTFVARRVLTAAGFDEPATSPGCPWIAVRNRSSEDLHLLATTARRNGSRPPLPATNQRVFDEVRAITGELNAQDAFDRSPLVSSADTIEGAATVVLRSHTSRVVTAEGGDVLARAILLGNGFELQRTAFDDGWMRTRYGTDTDGLTTCALTSAKELNALGYDVRLDAGLSRAAKAAGRHRPATASQPAAPAPSPFHRPRPAAATSLRTGTPSSGAMRRSR